MRRRSLLAFILLTLASLVTGGFARAQTTEHYKEILLGIGNQAGFSIDIDYGSGHTKKYRSGEWLAHGYTGVVFRGAGMGRTIIRASNLDQAVLVDRHAGRVRFENLTVITAKRQAIWFGLQHTDRPIEPKFRLEMENCEILTEAPGPDGVRGVWALFGYQSDVILRNVKIDHTQGTEHASYWRGFASADGIVWENVVIPGAGSQGFKIRNSPSEMAWVEGGKVRLIDCKIENTGQAWTWRGPGCFVAEGPGCDIQIIRCLMKGGPGERAKTLMIDDAGGDFYSATNGARGRGYAAGHIVIKDSGIYAGPGQENLTPNLRVCGNGPGANLRYIAKSVTVTGSGVFGDRTQLVIGNVPLGKGKVVGCNTPAIKALATAMGLDSSIETRIALQHTTIPVSQGYTK